MTDRKGGTTSVRIRHCPGRFDDCQNTCILLTVRRGDENAGRGRTNRRDKDAIWSRVVYQSGCDLYSLDDFCRFRQLSFD